MHGGVHPREVGAPHGPRVARDGVRKKQLLDHDIIGCLPVHYWAYSSLYCVMRGGVRGERSAKRAVGETGGQGKQGCENRKEGGAEEGGGQRQMSKWSKNVSLIY